VACAAAGTADVVDAIVVATAVRHQAPIVTSDPGDLTQIANSIGVKIQLYPTWPMGPQPEVGDHRELGELANELPESPG
jgi:hypothetical protein